MILILGRFQPLHKGHLKVIKAAYRKDKKLVIVIGSSQKKDEPANPFSTKERKLMLENSLKANKISARIVPAPDICCDRGYVSYLERKIGTKPEMIITENDWTIQLFKKAGYNVVITPRYFGISSTDIRKRIAGGRKWEHLVPKEVVMIIKKIKGVQRMKKLVG